MERLSPILACIAYSHASSSVFPDVAFHILDILFKHPPPRTLSLFKPPPRLRTAYSKPFA